MQDIKDTDNNNPQNQDEGYFLSSAEEVENELYYKEMKEWYLRKYTAPVVERSILIVLSALAISASVISIYLVSVILPVREQVPIAVPIFDSDVNSTELFRLDELIPEEDTNISLQKYLLLTFLEARESYDYEDDFSLLTRNENFLKRLATGDVVEEYQQLINENNPFSIKLVYRKNTRVEIDTSARWINIVPLNIDEVEQFSEETKQDIREKGIKLFRAETVFYKDVITPQEVFREQFIARLDFSYDDVKFLRDEGKFAPLIFRVFNYEAEPV